MAFEIATLLTIFDADIRPLEDGIKRAEARLKGAERTFGATGQAASNVGRSFLASAGGVTALGAGLGGVTAALVIGSAAVINYSGRLEQAKIAFTTLLGSSQAAEKHLKQLAAFANISPFEFPDVVKASRRFQAMGIAAQEVLPLLEAIGNAVAAAGGGADELQGVALAIAQIGAKGKVSAEELNQLADRGIGGAKILAKELHITTAEVLKLSEQGKISSATFIDAFQKFSKQNFAGAMQAQSRTFLGSLSTIKDSLLSTTAEAVKPFTEAIRDMTVALADAASGASQGPLSNLGDNLIGANARPDAFVQYGRDLWDWMAKGIREEAAATDWTAAINSMFSSFSSEWQSAVQQWKGAFGMGEAVNTTGWGGGAVEVSPAAQRREADAAAQKKAIDDLNKYVDESVRAWGKLQGELEKIKPGKDIVSDLAQQVRTFGDDTALTAATERFRALREQLEGLKDFAPEAVAAFNQMEQNAIAWAKQLDAQKFVAEQTKKSDDTLKALRETQRDLTDRIGLFNKSAGEQAVMMASVAAGADTLTGELRKQAHAIVAVSLARARELELLEKQKTSQANLDEFIRGQVKLLRDEAGLSGPLDDVNRVMKDLIANFPKMRAETAASIKEFLDFNAIALEVAASIKKIPTFGAIERVGSAGDLGDVRKIAVDEAPGVAGLQAIADAEKAGKDMRAAFENSFAGMFQNFSEGWRGVMGGFVESFGGALQQMLAKATATRLLEALGFGEGGWFSKLLGIGLGAVTGGAGALNSQGVPIASYGGGRASGGPVWAGESYMVGEQGREMITMAGPGYVTPNSKMGGPVYNINVNVPVRSAAGYSQPRSRREIGEQVAATVQGALS